MKFIPCDYTFWELLKDIIPWGLTIFAILIGKKTIEKLIPQRKATLNLINLYKKKLKEIQNIDFKFYIKNNLKIIEEVFIVPNNKTFKNYFEEKCSEYLDRITDEKYTKWDPIIFAPSLISQYSENVKQIIENKIIFENYIRKNNKIGYDELMLVYANFGKNIVIQIYCRDKLQ